MTTPINIYEVIVIWFLPCLFFSVLLWRVHVYMRKEKEDNFYTRETEGYDKLKEEEEDKYRSRFYSGDIH